MPIPAPKAGEDKDEYMGRCMSFMKGEKKKYKTHEQRVAICLTTFRGKSEDVVGRIDKLLDAVVVGDVGKKIATETQCPKGQRWCAKCYACIDVREDPGTGVPAFQCPGCKKTFYTRGYDAAVTGYTGLTGKKGNMSGGIHEATRGREYETTNVDLSNILTNIYDFDKDKWIKVKVKDLRALEKKMGGKVPKPETYALKLQIDKMRVKKLWFYLDPYDEFIYTKWTVRWAFSQREADNEIQDSVDAVDKKQPWGEKSFGKLKTL